MGIHGSTFSVPLAIGAEWWRYCADENITVEIFPPLTMDVPKEFDGVCYRRGVLHLGSQQLSLLPSPGQRPESNGDYVGSSLIILVPINCDSTMVDLIGNRLIHAGAQQIV